MQTWIGHAIRFGAIALAVALPGGAAHAQANSGEDSLIEGGGLIALLQGQGLSAASPASPANSVAVSQTGDGHTLFLNQSSGVMGAIALLDQSGSGHSAGIAQLGDFNAAHVTQLGADNALSLQQSGHGNGFSIVQDGTGLGLGASQYGGAQIIITQRNN